MGVRNLETARLRLRVLQPDDLDALAELYADPEVMRFLSGVRTREQTQTLLSEMIKHWQDYGFGRWALIDRAGGQFVGRCGLNYLPESPEIELGYAIAGAYWGRGLTTEAARACLHWGFEDVGLERIVAIARPENRASLRVMEKLGMKYEKDAFFYNTDVKYYALSRDAFRLQKP
jgi:ribosomal-protein-alanine N-acetyltransferase